MMVAITVILAAVIAAFVLDLGDTSESAQANFDIHQGGDGVDYLNATVQNADRIDTLEIRGDCTDADFRDHDLDSDFDKSVGDTFDIDVSSCSGDEEILLVAVYDGSENIVNSHTYEA